MNDKEGRDLVTKEVPNEGLEGWSLRQGLILFIIMFTHHSTLCATSTLLSSSPSFGHAVERRKDKGRETSGE